MKAWLIGGLKSFTAWFGTTLVLFPFWWPHVEPLLAELLTPAQYKWLVSLAGVITVLLRMKTTEALPDKASGPMAFGSSQRGFIRLPVTFGLLAISLILAGCPSMPRAPSGPLEMIEAAELTADQVREAVDRQVCTVFVAGVCNEAGKSLMPGEAVQILDEVSDIRQALRAAVEIGESGVGACLGARRTQIECLRAAQALLARLEQRFLMGTPQ